MADGKLDTKRFAAEVFVPVREGWEVRRNLFRLFQLPLDVRDADVIEKAVRGVDAHLKLSSLGGVNKTAAKSLLPKFAELAATMRETARRTAHRDEVRTEHRRFAERVRAEMRGMPALRSVELDEHAARAKSHLVRREVEEALAAAGIAVRDPVLLPAAAPPRWSETRLALRSLEHPDLAHYLTAHELGASPSAADVQRVRDTLDRTASGDTLTAEERVLAEVARLVAAGTLADALRYELVDQLTERAEQGADVLAAALAEPDVWRRVTGLGLPGGDDLAYALLCRARPAGSADARWRKDYEQARSARDLRTAYDLLSAQSGLSAELADQRAQLEAELAEVNRGLAEAAALETGDPEAAAARYLTVLRLAHEPEAEAGLRRCKPPAPPSAKAHVEGGGVRVVWETAPVRAGDPTYRVERRVDAGPHAGRTAVRSTADTSAVDPDPPAGTAVVYEVTTVREGATSARPAVTAPLVVLPPAAELVAESGDNEVRLRWTLPDGAVAARLTRSDDTGRIELPAATTTAHDPTARSGTAYTYAVEACYDIDGVRSYAQAVVATAYPQALPIAVDDLWIADDDNGTSVAGWTAPAHGSVVLRLEHRAPPPPGTILRAGSALGAAVSVLGRDPAGLRIDLPPAGRRRWVVPLTVAGELAAVGRAVEQDLRLPPVAALRATLQGNQARLSWKWPDQAGSARVLQREGAPVDGPYDAAATVVVISRAVFERSGCRLPAPPGTNLWFAVSLTAFDGEREVLGPLVQTRLAPPAVVSYAILPAGRDRRLLVVTGSAPLPPVEVRARIAYPPLRRTEGDPLVTVRPDDDAARQMRAEFTLSRGRPLHLRAFAIDPATPVELRPEDPDQLRVDRRRRRWW